MINNKMKGLLKGLRYISQIFEEEEEREMQIGYPTDVKHVAHIGCDGPSSNAPSWMGEYKSEPSNDSVDSNGKRPNLQATDKRPLTINTADSPVRSDPPPHSPAKQRHRQRSASDSPPGDKDAFNRGTRHSRRHQSAGVPLTAANSPNKDPSDGGSRRGRRQSKLSGSSSVSCTESPVRDIPAVPKTTRHRKTKEDGSSAISVVVYELKQHDVC